MKKFLIYFAGFLGVTAVCIYLAFLFLLPNVVDLNKYLPDLKKIVKEQANVDLEIENPKISTNMLLQAGIKTGRVTAKLPDGSKVLDIDSLKVRVSLPNLLLFTIKVSCAEINSPKINLEIENGEQYKVVRLVEDILNKKKNEPVKNAKPLPVDISKIKIKVPHAKISNYNILINDTKSSHKLTLLGEKLVAGYNNRQTAKLKTEAKILSDENVNIVAKLDLDSFLPPAKEKDLEDDPAEKIELPFVNPVLVYRNYDLKSNIDAKLKLRKDNKNGRILKGHLNIDDTTVNLSGLQLPKSYIHGVFHGDYANIMTNLAVTQNQKINIAGRVGYGKNPDIDIDIFTDKIYFNDLIILAKAFLDTLQVKNNLAYIKAQGYWVAKANIKSDLENLKSNGCIIARDGSISNGATHLVFDNIKANLIFENDILNITDTQTYINGGILKAEGKIDTNSYSNIVIHSERLPLAGLFQAFAPSDLRRSITMNSGTLSLDAKIEGFLKNPVAYANAMINNLVLSNDTFNLNNEKLIAGVVTDLKTIDGNITNKNLKVTIPKTNSVIQNPNISIKLNEQDITINPTNILVNSASKIGLSGSLTEYSSNPVIKLDADGYLNAGDLKKFAGNSAAPFIEAKGILPVKANISGTDKKQAVVVQIKSDASNYITPVMVNEMLNKQSILQAKIDRKKDKLHIRKTGFFTNTNEFSNNFEANLSGAQKIADINGTIIHTNTAQPFINIIKLDVPKELNAKFSAFKNSSFKMQGGLLVFGKKSAPVTKGNFRISDLHIPELLTNMNSADLNILGKNIDLTVKNLLLNGSDVNLTAKTDLNPHPVFTIYDVRMLSRMLDVDRLLKVPELLSRYTVPSSSSDKSDIPLLIRNGSINVNGIKSGNIKLSNTSGNISLKDNVFFLDNLRTAIFNGNVSGKVSVNLLSILIDAKLKGENLNVENALYALAEMKDTLTGTLDFDTDVNFSGTTPEEIMKNLKGKVTFTIADGQLGPFGKLENMIMAENIRESKFFQTALGGVINNLATIDTSHFKEMQGLITFADGLAHIKPITTTGNVMSIHVAGDFNLLENKADMKVRAKLGSVIANLLGPLAQLNPINLIEATPGLNVVMAKTFFLFCESLSPEESAALTHLESPMDDRIATKFQIVLRGDVSKPLSLIKSFKWLALSSEIDKAKNFVSTLPEPIDDENATLEEILKAQEEKAKEDAKLKNKIIKIFKKEK